jgi:hypothetical protein
MNTRERLSRSFLIVIVIALAGWVGLVLQLIVSVRKGMADVTPAWHSILFALSYFTVLTNLLVTVLVSARVGRISSRNVLSRPGTLAAAAVYILVVGIIYSVLLRTLWAPSGMHKAADVILHDLMPVLYLLWWLLFAPKGGLTWSDPFKWLAYPLAYFAFSLVLGHFTGRYLYPFADIPAVGLAAVARNGALLLVLFWGLGLVAVLTARMTGSAATHT